MYALAVLVVVAVVLLTLIPANDIALSALNQLVTAILPPRTLPKLELREGGLAPIRIAPAPASKRGRPKKEKSEPETHSHAYTG